MTRWVAALLVLACLALRCTPPFAINHDCGWYLYLVDRWLSGGGLYSELVEVNPPLIIYLTVAPVALARSGLWESLGLTATVAFDVCVLMLLFGSLWMTWLVGRTPSRERAPDGQHPETPNPAAVFADPLVLVVVAFASVFLPGRDFGQREHLAVMFTLPYFVLAVSRGAGGGVGAAHGLAIGVVASIGFCLKPHFLLAPVLVRLVAPTLFRSPSSSGFVSLELRSLGLRSLGLGTWRAENVGLLAGVLLYSLHFLFVPFRDEFFAVVSLVRESYGGFEVSIGEQLSRPDMVHALAVTLAVFFAGVASRRHRSTLFTLLVAQIAFLAAAIWQGKGFSYHTLPAVLLGYIGLATILGGASSSSRAVAVWILLGCAALPLGQHWLARDAQSGALGFEAKFTGIPPDCAAAREVESGEAILVLDTDMNTFFAWMAERNIEFASRYACLWPLPGGHSSARARLRREVFDDMEARRPRIVFVREGQPSFMESETFSILAWLRADPRFVDAFGAYDRIASGGESEGRFAVFRRRGD